MKSLQLLGFLFIFCFSLNSQTSSHTVDGKNIELHTDIEGTLTLLWNTIDKQYRYFIKKEDAIVELVNDKVNNKYTNSYREQLKALTTDYPVDTKKTNLTLASLRAFTNSYNIKADSTYKTDKIIITPGLRLGGFFGITNNIFTQNPENVFSPQLGIDFEILAGNVLPRHSIVVQYKQTRSSDDDFDFDSSQLSINHRFKFIKSDAIDVFVNTKLTTLTFSSRGRVETIEEGVAILSPSEKTTSFQGPLLFGLGADIALGKGYLTLNYHDAYSFLIDDNGEFPIDLSIGYKFTL